MQNKEEILKRKREKTKQWRQNNLLRIKAKDKSYYWSHREIRLNNNKKWRNENKGYIGENTRERLLSYKIRRGLKCQICGYNKNWAALDWHHIKDDKEIDISSYARKRRNWRRVEAEINKCILICANCHAETHYPHANIKEKINNTEIIVERTAARRN